MSLFSNLRKLCKKLGLVAVLLPIVFAAAQVKTNSEPSPTIVPASQNSLDADDGSISEYRARVQQLLKARNYGELEKLAKAARENKSKFKGGVWKLYIFYQALKQPVNGRYASEDEWNEHMVALAGWASSVPDSDTVRIAMAEASIIFAAKLIARPGNVDPNQQRDVVAKSLHLAELLLKSASEKGSRCPHLDFVRLQLLERQNQSAANQAFEKAIKSEPSYYPYFRLHALYRRPEWGGRPGEAEAFAESIADRIGGADGDIVYFEIASALDIAPSTTIFKIANLSWARIERGFTAQQSKYGKSPAKLNQFALLAMRADQLEAAAAAMSAISDQWDKDTWGESEYFDYSREFASATADIVNLRRVSARGMNTSEGKQYLQQSQNELLVQIMPEIERCTDRSHFGPTQGVDLFVRVGRDGQVLESRVWPETKYTSCFTPAIGKMKFDLQVPPPGVEWLRVTKPPLPDMAAIYHRN